MARCASCRSPAVLGPGACSMEASNVASSTQGTIASEVLRGGTAGALAMVPFGMFFRALGLRVNEYGRRTLLLFTHELDAPVWYALQLVQHLIIGWIASIPLILALGATHERRRRAWLGLAYGLAFYAIVNSLALPIAFGDPTPWQLGPWFVIPSLVVHIVYGLVVALISRPIRGR